MCYRGINTWITKTWVRNLIRRLMDEGYTAAEAIEKANEIVEQQHREARYLATVLREISRKIKERKVNRKWRHVCGFTPRYIDYSISDNEVMVWGGEKWRLKLVKDGDGKWIEISDGCWSTEDVIDQLEHGWVEDDP